jgi:long-chain acyl-CoA synthetase
MTKTGQPIPPTIPAMFFGQVAKYGERAALLRKVGASYQPISWEQLAEQVRATARGLISIGVKPGERVAIMAYNRPEWLIADLAIMAAGAITVPIYHTSTTAQSNYILEQAGALVAFVARSEKAEILATCAAPLHQIISLDPVGPDSPGSCGLDYPALLARGRADAGGETERELTGRLAALKPEDCATIIFTSGTTGSPKGVMLTHANLLTNAAAGLAAVEVDDRDLCLSFLPLSHSFERTAGQFLMLLAGATIAYAASIRTVADNLREVRPTIVLGVPRFFEKLHGRILEAVQSAPPWRQKLFAWAMAVGRQRSTTVGSAPPPGLLDRLRYRLADLLVFRKFRARLGGRLRFFVSGGAPLDPELVRFFLAAGIQILEGYGLTEHAPVIAVNRFNHIRPGTVGPPLPGCQVKILADGEVAVQSPSVTPGYFNDPAATAAIIRDGWLLTGDLGRLDDGYLTILDRKKEIIVNAGGKNISPQYLENLLTGDEFISQAVVSGDRRPYLTALIVPDFGHLLNRQPLPGLAGLTPAELATRPELAAFLLARIGARCRDLAPFETVRKIVLLAEPLSEERGELTPTQKVKRQAVLKKYQPRLDALYQEDESSRPRSRWP